LRGEGWERVIKLMANEVLEAIRDRIQGHPPLNPLPSRAGK